MYFYLRMNSFKVVDRFAPEPNNIAVMQVEDNLTRFSKLRGRRVGEIREDVSSVIKHDIAKIKTSAVGNQQDSQQLGAIRGCNQKTIRSEEYGSLSQKTILREIRKQRQLNSKACQRQG